MLYIVVSDDKAYRHARVSEIVGVFADSDIITLDDTLVVLEELEQYLYPSLFTIASPIVHARFMLDAEAMHPTFAKKLAASPTIFVFEEIVVPGAVLTAMKKHGAIVHDEAVKKTAAPRADMFASTAALTAPNKKDRWLAYQSAIGQHAIEAILGILYWKVRDLMLKGKDREKWEAIYRSMIDAHARAWQTGSPLTLAIEKVILSI
jgi:hypothetical protein